MADYALHRLNTREFEHLIQALAIGIYGPKTSIYGDGPDAAREATINGKISTPDGKDWEGYAVLQCKFRGRGEETGTKILSDTDWAIQELLKDLAKFKDVKRALKAPDYYVYVTNVVLTPAKGGGQEKVNAILEKEKAELGIKDFDVWHYDKICRFIDGNADVRSAYGGFISTGDVLETLKDALHQIGQSPRLDFWKIMTQFLEVELRQDYFAKLEQAGYTQDQRISLSAVFIDIETAQKRRSHLSPSEAPTGIVSKLVQVGEHRLKQLDDELDFTSEEGKVRFNILPSFDFINEERLTVNNDLKTIHDFQESALNVLSPDNKRGRFVLIGGPGQGKSTVTQFLCQLYRASILSNRPRLSAEAKEALLSIVEQSKNCGVILPETPRFPIYIVLDEFAALLSRKEVSSVFDFIRLRIRRLTNHDVKVEDLEQWLERMPWLLILDGLDEVPASSNRTEVLEAIQQFRETLQILNSDILIVATTRPQGYNQEFSPRAYQHYHLSPLSIDQALKYAKRLASVRFHGQPDRYERIIKRLQLASEEPMTARLMKSPLQVTIMATLVDIIGRPPKERWRLFARYFEVFYERETRRDIALSRVLGDHRETVELMHRRVGLELQRDSEHAGSTEARIDRTRLENILRSHFQSEECTYEQTTTWTKEILDAALHRLVFLVAVQEDKVGFEVRSLQEFMAAEALMDGSDDVVRQRLRTIAIAPHWRNVFLFAAGKCFSEKKHLFDFIIQLCSELNESDSSFDTQVCEASLAGSKLAVDILQDDLTRQSPRLQKQLLRIAFRLLETPTTAHLNALASVYEKEYADIYKQAIESRLKFANFDTQYSCWDLLKFLSANNVEWAIDMAILYWPQSKEQQASLFRVLYDAPLSWVQHFAPAVIPHIEVSAVNRLVLAWVHKNETTKTLKTLEALAPQHQWLVSAFNLVFNTQIHDSDSITCTVGGEGDESSLSFKLTKTLPTVLSNNLKILEMPDAHISWSIIKHSAFWLKNPTTQNMAQILRSISEEWKQLVDSVDDQQINNASITDSEKMLWSLEGIIPWPIFFSLKSCSTSAELHLLADKVALGEMGQVQDWLEAENSWRNDSIKVQDFNSSLSWPFHVDKNGIKFPIFASFNKIPSIHTLAALYEANKSGVHEVISRHWADEYYSQICMQQLSHCDLPKDVHITPTKLRELILILKPTYIIMDFVQNEELMEFSLDKWIDTFELIGTNVKEFWFMREPVSQPTLKYIVSAFALDPSRLGLLRVIVSALEHGVNMPSLNISLSMIKRRAELANRKLTIQDEANALLLELHQSPPLSREQADTYAVRIVDIVSQGVRTVISSSLGILEKLPASVNATSNLTPRNLLATSLWQSTESSFDTKYDELNRHLSRALGEMKSDLSKELIWKKLLLH